MEALPALKDAEEALSKYRSFKDVFFIVHLYRYTQT